MTDQRQLYLARISEADEGMPNDTLNMLYVAFATSQSEAEVAIRRARSKECSVEFRSHNLPVTETVERLGLHDGAARSLA